MVTMAIDASSKSTGVAIFKDKQLIHYECITSSLPSAYTRIKFMVAGIKKIYDEYKPTRVIMEDVLPDDVRHNQQVFNVLHYLQAAIVLHLYWFYEQEVELVTASHWRSQCGIHTGRGITRETLKAADIKFVADNYNITVNDDIADAICIGWSITHI